MSIINYKGIDISKVNIYDVSEIFPNFPPIIISPIDEMSHEKFRVLSLWIYADNYNIFDLKEALENYYNSDYPDIFYEVEI